MNSDKILKVLDEAAKDKEMAEYKNKEKAEALSIKVKKEQKMASEKARADLLNATDAIKNDLIK